MRKKDDHLFYHYINEQLYSLREQERSAMRDYDYEGVAYVKRAIEVYENVRKEVAKALAQSVAYDPATIIDAIDDLAKAINNSGQTFNEKMHSISKLAIMGSLLKVWSDSYFEP